MNVHTMAFIAAMVSALSLGCAVMTTVMLREQNRALKQILRSLYDEGDRP